MMPENNEEITVRILEDLVQTLEHHITSEESALIRIEKLLDGNGQKGLIREHSEHGMKLSQLEQWKKDTATECRWLIGLIVTVILAVVALALSTVKK